MDALKMALFKRKIRSTLLLHSDCYELIMSVAV